MEGRWAEAGVARGDWQFASTGPTTSLPSRWAVRAAGGQAGREGRGEVGRTLRLQHLMCCRKRRLHSPNIDPNATMPP